MKATSSNSEFTVLPLSDFNESLCANESNTRESKCCSSKAKGTAIGLCDSNSNVNDAQNKIDSNDLSIESRDTDTLCGIEMSATKILLLTLTFNLTFTSAQLVGALMSHSLALLGDTICMYVDTLTYFLNWITENKKEKMKNPKTRKRFELFAPFISVLLLIGATGYVTYEAIRNVSGGDDEDEVDERFMFGFGFGNLAINIIEIWLFWRRAEKLKLCPIVFFKSIFANILCCSCFKRNTTEIDGNNIKKKNKKNEKRSVEKSIIVENSIIVCSNNNDDKHQPLVTNDINESIDCEGQTKMTKSTKSTKCSTLCKEKCTETNINLLSAFSHILADTMRTTAELVAAFLIRFGGCNDAITDAAAALFVNSLIFIGAFTMLFELYGRAQKIQ